jgi:outer membrane protein assembly factor BamB
VALAGAGLAGAGLGGAAGTAYAANWPSYLNGASHSSYNAAENVIRPGNVGRLAREWRFRGDRATRPGQPRPGFLASPIVVDGAVYIGSDTGWFYKLDERTGAVLAKRFIGFQPPKTCGPRGFVATATVAIDRSDGQRMVYVAGANGVLYALRASDLSVKWRSVIALPARTTSNYFQWSSPTLADDQIYVGISSNCDHPLVPGGLVSYHQATGARIATFHTVASGLLGGSIWSSAAVSGSGDVYVTTGNAAKGKAEPAYADSIVKLNPRTLRPLASFAVPVGQVIRDGDFGGSPTLFRDDVGACDKNGIYYAVHVATMTLAWSVRIGAPANSGVSNCASAALYDGKSLYVGGDAVTIGGRAYRGSLQRLDPATGKVLWATGLPNGVIGTPAMDGAGVIAVGTYDFSARPNAIYLVDAVSGRILRVLVKGSYDFAQSVFAEGRLFTANGRGLSAWGLRRSRRHG